MTRSQKTLLVVDDDRAYRSLLCDVLDARFAHVLSASSGEEALEQLAAHPVDLMLLDMRMSGIGGLGVLEQLSREGADLPVLVLTAFAEVEDAVRAMKLGARDYLRKPIDLVELLSVIEEHLGRGAENTGETPDIPPGFVAESAAMHQLLAELRQIAASDAPLLLLGESGTGKEAVAQLVHRWSRRSSGPLTTVNVTALPVPLVESELFGHARGAFTGADEERDGLLQAAHHGTLFLDEIGDMPLSAQPKLLRALESGEVKRVGENNATLVDFRLISATHRDLERSIEAGEFRLDLYYRLAVVSLEIPALRERREDVLPLARQFLSEQPGGRKQLSPDVCQRLEEYAWPGNIRELRNVMTRAAILSPGDRVLLEHLPPTVLDAAKSHKSSASLADLERRSILATLERHGGNRTRAAQELGISRRKLLYRLKEYGAGSE